MILIGITGPIGHGKSTLARFLADQEPNSRIFESSEVISLVATELNTFFEDANPDRENLEAINVWLSHLPQILSTRLGGTYAADVFVITKEQIEAVPRDYEKLFEYIDLVQKNPGLVDIPITQENKAQYRAILQWIGGYCVTHIRRTIWNEELIRRAINASCPVAILGGVRFAEEAQNIQAHGGVMIEIERSNSGSQDSDDPTERERSKIAVDATVRNDQNLETLQNKSIQLLLDLKANTVKTTY